MDYPGLFGELLIARLLVRGDNAEGDACEDCERYKLETRSSHEVLRDCVLRSYRLDVHMCSFGELLTVFNCNVLSVMNK
jgi:hypothetical protein